jgi:type I restriction enzyme M protein
LFGFGYRIGVSTLSQEAARELVTRPVEGRLIYVEEARNRLVELVARQPFLIQSLANRVFESAARGRTRIVTVAMVERAAEEMIHDNEHFQTLWDYPATERRRLLLGLCQQHMAGPDPLTIRFFEVRLEELGIPIPEGDSIGADIDFLRELELLERDPLTTGTVYRLAIPLLGDWIRANVDFEDQRQRAIREGEENAR